MKTRSRTPIRTPIRTPVRTAIRSRIARHLLPAACLLALALPGTVLADGSERDTPADEQKLKLAEMDLPVAVQEYIGYVLEFDARYPDTGAFDMDQVMREEGERYASLYCAALGFDGPCAPDESSADGGFVAVSAEPASTRTASAKLTASDVPPPNEWWEWIIYIGGRVGVIPETSYCPAPYFLTNIYMDDENRNNGNSRSGWIGATVSTSNTRWHHCKLSRDASWQFRPLAKSGPEYDYAVLSLGPFCPSGARRVWRFHDNEDNSNGNSGSGPYLPNLNVGGKNWMMQYCYFQGGAPSFNGHMNEFPHIGMKYGVYAARTMPAPFSLAPGRVRHDDEDFANVNFWLNLPSGSLVMGDSANTIYWLSRVR